MIRAFLLWLQSQPWFVPLTVATWLAGWGLWVATRSRRTKRAELAQRIRHIRKRRFTP
jgi:hypothetical protein